MTQAQRVWWRQALLGTFYLLGTAAVFYTWAAVVFGR
jgi:hypothetical protein